MIPVFIDENKANEQIIKPISRSKLPRVLTFSHPNQPIKGSIISSERRVLGDITNSTPKQSTNTTIKSISRGLSNTIKNVHPMSYPKQPQSPSVTQHQFMKSRLQFHSQQLQSPLNLQKDAKNMDDVEIGTMGPFEDHIVPDVAVDMKKFTEGLNVHQSYLLPYDPDPARLEIYEDPELDDLLNTDEYVDVENAYGTMHYTSPLPKYDPEVDFNVSKLVHASKMIGGIPAYEHSPLPFEAFGDLELDDKLKTFSLEEFDGDLHDLLDM